MELINKTKPSGDYERDRIVFYEANEEDFLIPIELSSFRDGCNKIELIEKGYDSWYKGFLYFVCYYNINNETFYKVDFKVFNKNIKTDIIKSKIAEDEEYLKFNSLLIDCESITYDMIYYGKPYSSTIKL